MTRIFVRRKWLTYVHLINMKLTWNLCYSSSQGSDELLDEEFIPVFFLLLHLCIMCMWYKRALNAFFVSFFLPRGACKLNVWCMLESLWLWWLYSQESEWCLPKTVCKLKLLPEQNQLKIFCCSWKECLSFCLYFLLNLRLSLKWFLCIMIE